MHPGSGDQIGHFLGAVRAGHSFPASIAWSQMLAHEFESSSMPGGLRHIDSNLRVYKMDSDNFRSGNLDRIPLDTSQFGVSYQDLYLTYFGLRFAEMVDQGRFANLKEAARFLKILLTPVDLNAVPEDEFSRKFAGEIAEIDRLLVQIRVTQTQAHESWRQSELQQRAADRELRSFQQAHARRR